MPSLSSVMTAASRASCSCNCAPDVALLDGARAGGVGDDALVIDGQVGESLADTGSIGVGADDACDRHLRAESAKHRRDAAGAAEAFLAPLGMQQDDGRLLAN